MFKFLQTGWQHGNLLPSKGYFWLATRPDLAGSWSQAGGIMQHGFAGLFWASVAPEQWPNDAEARQLILERWSAGALERAVW